ncbi:Cullin-domain-containing protein [Pisolithus albus]|nr:Cullin-domain-containing protein [Pisolithus albus]
MEELEITTKEEITFAGDLPNNAHRSPIWASFEEGDRSRLVQIPSYGAARISHMWAFLKEGFDQIMLEGVKHTHYVALYTVAFHFCNLPRSRFVLPKLRYASERPGAYALYQLLLQYFNSWLKVLREDTWLPIAGSVAIDSHARRTAVTVLRIGVGEVHNRGDTINRILAYLNRHGVQHWRAEGGKDMYPVYTLAFVQWKAILFDDLQAKTDRLVGAALGLVRRECNGERIDHSVVKEIVGSFVSLGLDDADVRKALLDICKEHLEFTVALAVRKYSEPSSEVIFTENKFSKFLREVDERLQEEENRIARDFDPDIRIQLLDGWQVPAPAYLLKEFPRLLLHGKLEDLRRLYAISVRTHWKLDQLRTQFGEHAKEAGMSVVSRLIGEGTGGADGLDLGKYVDALFEVHQKYSKIVAECLMGDVGFRTSLGKACRNFVNCNDATGPSDTKPAELLANYADRLLRRKDKTADDGNLESSLHRLGVLFTCIEDKDIFWEIYSMRLAKRLVYGFSVSDEAEMRMVSKMKEVCGVEYTNKMERMIIAVNVSKDITDQFNRNLERDTGDLGVNFSIMIFGANCWSPRPPNTGFVIPPEILSTAELTTSYLNRKYILVTSSYQMAVLLQYNTCDTLTLDELIAATAINKDILIKALLPIVKSQILVSQTTDQYDLNPNFKQKKTRVNLYQPTQVETQVASTEVLKAVSEERKHVIQAAIVRTMKAQKTMKSQALIEEVISQLSQRFVPNVSDVKKAIDVLLERDYIERTEGAPDTFAYIV